jgi:hypothetical protein
VEKVRIIDHKTHPVKADSDRRAQLDRYGLQLGIYSLAVADQLRSSDQQPVSIEASLCFTRDGSSLGLTFDEDRLIEVEKEVGDLVGGILAGDFTPQAQLDRGREEVTAACGGCPLTRVCHHHKAWVDRHGQLDLAADRPEEGQRIRGSLASEDHGQDPSGP